MENLEEKGGMSVAQTQGMIAVVPMRKQVVFPNVKAWFDVARKSSVLAIENAFAGGKRGGMLFLARQKDASQEDPTSDDLVRVGTVVLVRELTKLQGSRLRVSVEGLYRAKVRSYGMDGECIFADIVELTSRHGDPNWEEAYFRTAQALVSDIIEDDGKISKEVGGMLSRISDIDEYINVAAHHMRLKEDVKQQLLEETSVEARLRLFERCLNDELEISRLERKINNDVRHSIDQAQKEYFLREQLRAIHSELGDDMDEGDKLKEKILAKKLPKEIEEKALVELARMDKMPPSSPEYTVLRNYADWLIDLPWHEQTEDTADLADVERVLDEDHYGLQKIKERVVEYLAVLKLTGELKAPILCLVGPPGVGKTSIAKSVARALNRNFVRMSLGGLKDEAEIRGHRRTYIGAMPGRIIYEMKNAKVVNPVFLLDEIDKVSSDMRGDPASALLEVLDPEQNSTFRDRYLEVPYDLSKVMFIATANTLDTIPSPLRDRMEIIELSGYTPDEKLEIAKRYLVPKKRKENGLKEGELHITEGAINGMIDGFTSEAGVRTLERTVGTVCRKAAVKIAKKKFKGKLIVSKENLEGYLGANRYSKEDEMRSRDEVGAATGLAWTAVGGTTLTIEVALMPGKGEIVLTGKLGDVMKESARAAITYIRANAQKYGIAAEAFEKQDIHVHVPEGATPKDGPSAGITMATAILSAFTGKPVRRDVAMTGEITLRGKVLPIGGLKEKALAAHRLGIKDVIIPQINVKDLEEIPANIKKSMSFISVGEIDEVFKQAVIGV